MKKMVKKNLSDRVIVSNTTTNQFYCERCKYASNELYIFDGYGYCSKCTPIKDLPMYNQNNMKIG